MTTNYTIELWHWRYEHCSLQWAEEMVAYQHGKNRPILMYSTLFWLLGACHMCNRVAVALFPMCALWSAAPFLLLQFIAKRQHQVFSVCRRSRQCIMPVGVLKKIFAECKYAQLVMVLRLLLTFQSRVISYYEAKKWVSLLQAWSYKCLKGFQYGPIKCHGGRLTRKVFYQNLHVVHV